MLRPRAAKFVGWLLSICSMSCWNSSAGVESSPELIERFSDGVELFVSVRSRLGWLFLEVCNKGAVVFVAVSSLDRSRKRSAATPIANEPIAIRMRRTF